jgi:hypothetical protein
LFLDWRFLHEVCFEDRTAQNRRLRNPIGPLRLKPGSTPRNYSARSTRFFSFAPQLRFSITHPSWHSALLRSSAVVQSVTVVCARCCIYVRTTAWDHARLVGFVLARLLPSLTLAVKTQKSKRDENDIADLACAPTVSTTAVTVWRFTTDGLSRLMPPREGSAKLCLEAPGRVGRLTWPGRAGQLSCRWSCPSPARRRA